MFLPNSKTLIKNIQDVFVNASINANIMMDGFIIEATLGMFSIECLHKSNKNLIVRFKINVFDNKAILEEVSIQEAQEFEAFLSRCRSKMQGIYFSLQEVLEEN
jgi:hypothetical protein